MAAGESTKGISFIRGIPQASYFLKKQVDQFGKLVIRSLATNQLLMSQYTDQVSFSDTKKWIIELEK